MRRPEQVAVKRIRFIMKQENVKVRRPEQAAVKRAKKKHIASENVSCGYFTLLVQHEFAGGLADRCAEETGEEGMILET